MTVLSDNQIEASKIISPFYAHRSTDCNSNRILSYGASSYGYDIRLDYKLLYLPKPSWWHKLLTMLRLRSPAPAVNPLKYVDDLKPLTKNKHGEYVIEPHGFVLGVSVEYFSMPDNVTAICLGKSTYARVGLNVNVTPAEAGWQGYLTIELHNPTTRPIVLFPGQGICQMLFMRGEEMPSLTYSDRAGKYQHQPNVPVGPRP